MKSKPVLLAIAVCSQLIFSEKISGQQIVLDVTHIDILTLELGDYAFRCSDAASIIENPKISIAPIIGFGFAGLLLGGYIGNRIDPGPDIPGEVSPIFSKAESIGILVGTATGATFGFLLAKRDLKKQMKRKRQEKRTETSSN